MPVSPLPRSLKRGPKRRLSACQGIGRISLLLWTRSTSACAVGCACRAVGRVSFAISLVDCLRCTLQSSSALLITKLFSFSSPFVKRFSGLTRDSDYFPNVMSVCVCLCIYSTECACIYVCACVCVYVCMGGGEWGYGARFLRSWYRAPLQDSGPGRLGSETEGRNHIFKYTLCGN